MKILATQHNIDSRIVDLLFDHKKASHKSLVSTALQYGNLHVIKKIIKVMTDNVEHLECYLDAKECNEISAYLNTLSDIRTVDAEIHKALRVFLQYAHKKQSKNFTLPECVQSIKYLRLEHLIDEWLKPILDKDMKDAKTKLSKHLPDCSELLLGQISKDMLKKGVIKVTEMLEFSDRTEHYTAALKEERQFFDALSRYVTGDNVCTACFAWNEKIYFVNNNSKFEVVRNRLQSLWNDSEDHVVISDLQEDYYYTMLTIDAVKKAFKAIDGYIKVLAQIEHNVHTAAKDTKVKLEEILKSQKDGNIIETKYHTIERFIDLYNRIETLNHLMPDKIEKLYQSFSKDFRVFIAVKQDRDFLVKNMVKYINMPHDFVEQGEQFPNVKIWATESVTEGFRCLTLGGASDKIHGNFIPDPKKIPHADVQMLDLIQHLIQKGDEALRVCKEEVYIAINMPTCFMCFNVYKAYNQVRETHITYCVPTERIWPSWVYPHIIEDAGVMKCMEQYLDEARALGESLEGFSNLL